MTNSPVKSAYDTVKQLSSLDLKSSHVQEAIFRLVLESIQFLHDWCEPITLNSRVPGKQYFTFRKDNIVARPANLQYFLGDSLDLSDLWHMWLAGQISKDDFAKLTYTSALAPCLAMELLDRGNKKGPATFFECYVGHLVASALGVNPTKQVRLPISDQSVRMTMDFLINVSDENCKLHLPVKMSSRERVVQAWAHQRLLDSAYGTGAYRGVMMLFAETKLDSRTFEVVEICVPDQWLAYQSLLSQMERIYYFDIPNRYQALTIQYPDIIAVRPFADFFTPSEREAVFRSVPV